MHAIVPPASGSAAAPMGGSVFDPWLWLQAWQQTALATLDPAGSGRWLRDQRLARLLAVARRDSPLYARRAPRCKAPPGAVQRLQAWPPVGKAELMAGFDDWATDRRISWAAVTDFMAQRGGVADAWLGRYLPWTSSGSSGQPSVFVQDAAALAAFDAIDALRLGPPLQTLSPWSLARRLAYVGALGGRYAGHVSLSRLQRVVPAPWTPRITLLRYELADRVRVVPGRCPCGRALPVIEVMGRSDDVLMLPGAHGQPVAVLPLALESVIEEGTGVTQFQLLRRPDGELELRLGARPPGAAASPAACRDVLAGWLRRQGVARPLLHAGREPPLQQPGSGKLRRVVDLMAVPPA